MPGGPEFRAEMPDQPVVLYSGQANHVRGMKVASKGSRINDRKSSLGTGSDTDVIIVHSSDLHVDDEYTAHLHGGDGTSWQIAMAHGHYAAAPDMATALRPAWLIGDAAITATGADYVALEHWNRSVRVGNGDVAAYYSGSPELARTVNVVRLTAAGTVRIRRRKIRWDPPS